MLRSCLHSSSHRHSTGSGAQGPQRTPPLRTAPVFQLPRAHLACFLNRLLATDGWVATLATGQVQAGYASSSERMARQVQHLLLRFGVIARLRAKQVSYRGGEFCFLSA